MGRSDAAAGEISRTVLYLVLAVLLQVLAHGDGLLDKAVQILREGWGKSLGAEDAHDLVAGDHLDLWDSVGITKDNTNLRRGEALLGHGADLLDAFASGLLHPAWRSALVWEGTTGNTLSVDSTEGIKQADVQKCGSHPLLWRRPMVLLYVLANPRSCAPRKKKADGSGGGDNRLV